MFEGFDTTGKGGATKANTGPTASGVIFLVLGR